MASSLRHVLVISFVEKGNVEDGGEGEESAGLCFEHCRWSRGAHKTPRGGAQWDNVIITHAPPALHYRPGLPLRTQLDSDAQKEVGAGDRS